MTIAQIITAQGGYILASYVVDSNGLRKLGTDPRRGYRCSSCGVRGHSARTCGRPVVVEHRATRHRSPRLPR